MHRSLEQKIERYMNDSPKTGRRKISRLLNWIELAAINGKNELLSSLTSLVATQSPESVLTTLSSFGNHYHLADGQIQQEMARTLIDNFRFQQGRTLLESAKILLELHNLGPHMALTILKHIETWACQIDDFTADRAAKIKTRYPNEFGADKVMTFPLNGLWSTDREAWMEITKNLTPLAISQLIGVSVEEFAQNPKYEEVWYTAKNMLYLTNNPYDAIGRRHVVA